MTSLVFASNSCCNFAVSTFVSAFAPSAGFSGGGCWASLLVDGCSDVLVEEEFHLLSTVAFRHCNGVVNAAFFADGRRDVDVDVDGSSERLGE